MRLDLIILTPDHQSRRFTLDREAVTLGRAHSNDLCYADDASLSRRHLRFQPTVDGWVAEDFGSKNGTLRNGSRIEGATPIRPGDRLSAGHLMITVVDPDAPAPSSVVFVAGEGRESRPGATIMTSLEGLMSGEATAPTAHPRQPGGGEVSRGQAFNSPIVRALVRAGRELAGHRPLKELFKLILDLSIEAVGAERGVLMTLEGSELVSRSVHGEGFRISTTVRDKVLEEKTSLLVRDLTQDEAFRMQHSISEQQIQTMMAVPLQTEDRVIGLIYVDSRSFVRAFTPDDLNLLTVLANVAAIRIERERLAEVERREQRRTVDLEQAAEIQRAILPRGNPQVPGVDLAGHNAPCRTVGGDYFDFIPYKDGRVAVVVGDVAGKGMSAALLMSNLQARVQLLAESPRDLAQLMSRLDQSVSINAPLNRFITLFFGLVDPVNGLLTYVNAGHNPPLVIRADGSIEKLKAKGTVLGILPEIGYEEQSVGFLPGDAIAIYSDGVTEAATASGDEFGEDRLARLIADNRDRSAVEIIDVILDAVSQFTGGGPPEDDVTLLIARHTGLGV
ncbi:MAG TPA: SpoIIE family protein phosphatase [Candidatus Polarisedimenticolaceae bacterium]|nr:SpoIIE family protein phosphatase [Candidatus Polarisedimenticolaceae bacterium]